MRTALGRLLLVSCPTRWNSLFDAMKLVSSFFGKESEEAFDGLFVVSDALTESEKAAVKDYVNVMAHLAEALDELQGESHAYLGCLLPFLHCCA